MGGFKPKNAIKFLQKPTKRKNMSLKQNATNPANLSDSHNVDSHLDSANPTNPTNPSYQNYIALAFVLTAIYCAIYAIMRVFMTRDNISGANIFSADFAPMFIMGARLDLRAICVFAALVVILGYISSANRLWANRTIRYTIGGGKSLNNHSNQNRKIAQNLPTFIHKSTLILTALSALLVAFSAFVNFYYFATYHTKIDTFIFGLKDDETSAILGIIYNDYPLVRVILASVIFSAICYKIADWILRVDLGRFAFFRFAYRFAPFNSLKLPKFARFILIFLANLALLAIIFVGIRGSVGTFPLNESDAHFSPNPLLNHIATNPIMATIWAFQSYQRQDKFAPINPQDLRDLEAQLFPIFAHNSQQAIKNPPNVVAVLMESFGSNALELDSKSCDLLGSFRAHFSAGEQNAPNQSDFTFRAFLSATNGTAGSFAGLFFNSPSATISVSSVKNRYLPLTPFEIYKRAGYEVVFITSGNRSWHNLGDYILSLGADKVFDKNALIQQYPQSAEFENAYGVLDEFAFKIALEVLQNATKPTFIAMITTSNHPPYSKLPTHWTPPNCDIDSLSAHFTDDNKSKMRSVLNLFAYSSGAFGDFVSAVKNSALKDNTIIAGSGDHKLRDLRAFDNIALNFSVPLYLFIPPQYTRDFKARGFGFRRETLGSHKDIFPTLYALSLNDYDFLTLGGRNLFDTNAPDSHNFAFNDGLWIDSSGIYPQGAKIGYKYTIKNGEIMPNGESFELSKEKAEFMEKYKKLNWTQINYRIFNE